VLLLFTAAGSLSTRHSNYSFEADSGKVTELYTIGIGRNEVCPHPWRDILPTSGDSNNIPLIGIARSTTTERLWDIFIWHVKCHTTLGQCPCISGSRPVCIGTDGREWAPWTDPRAGLTSYITFISIIFFQVNDLIVSNLFVNYYTPKLQNKILHPSLPVLAEAKCSLTGYLKSAMMAKATQIKVMMSRIAITSF
jgi:hypothetical protein